MTGISPITQGEKYLNDTSWHNESDIWVLMAGVISWHTGINDKGYP